MVSLLGIFAGWLERNCCYLLNHPPTSCPPSCSLGGVCPFSNGHTCSGKDEITPCMHFMGGQRMASSDELGPPSGGRKTTFSCVLNLALWENDEYNLELLYSSLHSFHSLNVFQKKNFSCLSLYIKLWLGAGEQC